MKNIGMEESPNKTHKWGKWEDTIVSTPNASRFGKIRKCSECEAEEAFAGGAGSHWVSEEALLDCEGC